MNSAKGDQLEKHSDIISLKESCGIQKITAKVSAAEASAWSKQFPELKFIDSQALSLEELFIELTGEGESQKAALLKV